MPDAKYNSIYSGRQVDEAVGRAAPGGAIDKTLLALQANSMQPAPLFANSIEECTDPTKLYVLPDGFLYAYMQQHVVLKTNEYNPETATFNARINSSGSVVGLDGALLLPKTAVDFSDPYIVNITGVTLVHTYDLYVHATYYSNTGARLGSIAFDQVTDFLQFSDGDYSFDLYSPDYPTAKSVRLWLGIGGTTAITEEDVSNLVVAFEAKDKNEYVEGWANTGHAFVPADYEDRILAVETTAKRNAIDIETLGRKVEKLETEEAIGVFPSVWDKAVEACIAKVKALQAGKDCVTFPFFSDNHQRLGYAGALIAKVMEECHIPFCFYGGDSISSDYIANESAMIEQDKAFDAIMKPIPAGRLCRAVGNHDGYWAVNESEKHYYTREQVYELFLREEAVYQNKHYGPDGTYYYVEDLASKTRFVVLNDNRLDGVSLDPTQLAWLQNTALHFSESGWAVVFISHRPVTNNFHSNYTNAPQVQAILTGYINGTADNKADVVGWFAGHIHRDRIYQTDHTGNPDADDQTTVTLPWKTVTITSDHTGIAYEEATKHPIDGDAQSHAIDFVTVNRGTRTVHISRLGIGNDRSFTY